MPIGSSTHIQIRSNCLVYYEIPEYAASNFSSFGRQQASQLSQSRQKAYKGEFSDGAKKRLTRAIDLLVQSVKPVRMYNPITKTRHTHRLSFVTLTVSDKRIITAPECHKLMLYPFLQWLRRTMRVTTYVWKAEFQQRGQIHYHITTPSFIHWQSIRDKWNNLQQKAGYTNDYYSKHGHYDPNSTDIHEVYKVKNLSGYMKKEFCKNIQNDTYTATDIELQAMSENDLRLYTTRMNFKKWDCSANLKAYKYFTVEATQDVHKAIIDMADRDLLTMDDTDFCSIIKIKKNDHTSLLNLQQIQQYDTLLTNIRNHRTKDQVKAQVDGEDILNQVLQSTDPPAPKNIVPIQLEVPY